MQQDQEVLFGAVDQRQVGRSEGRRKAVGLPETRAGPLLSSVIVICVAVEERVDGAGEVQQALRRRSGARHEAQHRQFCDENGEIPDVGRLSRRFDGGVESFDERTQCLRARVSLASFGQVLVAQLGRGEDRLTGCLGDYRREVLDPDGCRRQCLCDARRRRRT